MAAIITEPQYPDKTARTLARETGAVILPLESVATGSTGCRRLRAGDESQPGSHEKNISIRRKFWNIPETTGSAAIAVEGISVSLHKNVILQEVTCDIPSGRITALIGPNGAGKTTLLLAIMGLIPYSGTHPLIRPILGSAPDRLCAPAVGFGPGPALHRPGPA